MKKFFSTDSAQEERRELTLPFQRVSETARGVMNIISVISPAIEAKNKLKEERYGKVQKVSSEFFKNRYEGYIEEVKNRPIQVEAPKSFKVEPANETILDQPVELDPLQFEAMAADDTKAPSDEPIELNDQKRLEIEARRIARKAAMSMEEANVGIQKAA